MNRPMYAGGGLPTGKLALANAALAEVLAGKTFYAGDKAIKTGTMPNRGEWGATYTGADVTIPDGYHNGAGKVSVDGGNKGAWSSSVSAGSSIAVPKGWHNGAGSVSSPANFSASSGNRDATGGQQEMRRDEGNRLAYANTFMRVNVSVQGRKVVVSATAYFHVTNNGTTGIVGDGDYSQCNLNFEIPF